MGKQRSPKQLAKLIDYMLSRRPDEFGLVADHDGFIKIKDLLKAITEEEGWRYVRRSHLDEILITLADPPFEVCDNFIRAKHREHLPQQACASDPPKLLYTCVRQKAYPHVSHKGLLPAGYSKVILASSRDLAERMGRRIDPSAVLLTVQVQHSVDKGVVYFKAGQQLYLADFIPPDCFSGPPLPKEKPAATRPDRPEKPAQYRPAGSFFVDLEEKLQAKSPPTKQKKKMKKHKPRRERPPWRR